MENDTLKDALESFSRKVDAEAEQRKVSQDDLEFALLEKQWPEGVKEQREKEGRPCLTINRLPAFLRQVTNDARMNRPSIHTKPLGDGANRATSRILNDLIRNIETQSHADVVYDTATDFSATCGIGYFVIRVDYTRDDVFDQDIMLERVSNPFSIYGDENSKSATSDDWNDAFIVDWYTKRQFERKWPGAKAASFSEGDEKDANWFEEGRIRVAEWWTREEMPTMLIKLSDGSIMHEPEFMKVAELIAAQGITVEGTRETKTFKVRQRIVTGKDVLEENDWAGKFIPIVPMYGEEVNVNGKRHFISLIRRAKDPQRQFNYWRTASTELVALAPKAPYIGPVGAFTTDAAKWQTANVKSHPYIEYDVVQEAGGAMPQRQPFAGVPAGALQEAMNASDDMKAIMGIYDASLGARSNETSGKAIMARQREGDISTFNFIDNRNRAVEHGGRIIVDLIPKVYTVARVMQGIREDGSSYQLPINQPVQVIPGQEGETYKPAPEHVEGVTQIFDLRTGKYGVTVTAGPSFTTRREESAEQMMEFIRIFPQAAPLIGDLLAKNLDWPGAEQVAERLRAMLPPQAHGQVDPMVQQLQQMLKQQDAMAKQAVSQLQQQIADLQKQLDDKKREDAIKEYDAETKRAKVVADAAKDGILLSRTATGDMQAQPILPPMPMMQNTMQTPPDGGVSAYGAQNTPEQPPGM